MLRRFYFLLIVFSLFFANEIFCFSANAAEGEDDSISLRLKAGMITEAEFPEQIANVTKGVSAASLQIETLGNRMFLLALENLDTNIYVVTKDNLSYCLHLIMDEIQAPTRIKIKKRPEKVNKEQGKAGVDTMEAMKALLSGRMPQGSASSKLHSQEIYNNGKFRVTIEEAYELSGNVKAFILTFENLSFKPVVVPIEHIEFPGLLAISIDSQLLEARPRDSSKKSLSGFTSKAYMIVEGLK